MITILGLGPGHPPLLTREAWDAIVASKELYARTGRHPTLEGLPPSVVLHTFDDLYDSAKTFDDVYREIADRVLGLGRRPEGVLYAVPGHPAVGEATVEIIRRRADESGLPVRVIAGLSFLEPVLCALNLDALPGLFVADALDLAARAHPPFGPDVPALVAQLYSLDLASDVKLTLMNQYPDDHRVALVHSASTPDERLEWLALHEIDRSPHVAHLTCLYVPATARPGSFDTFQNTMARLRGPGGCPWDKEQTHQSLRPFLLEEAYEALAALDSGEADVLREELGDLLLQIVLQAQIAIDDGEFYMADVIGDVNAKLIRRHPHVFGDVKVDGVEDVVRNWERLKEEERAGAPGGKNGLLASVPRALPALAQAQMYQSRAARVRFDWPDVGGVIDKVREEMAEVAAAPAGRQQEAEVGDLLFAVVNWARWLGADAESALRGANERFARRFARLEAGAQAQGRELSSLTLEEMDALWEAAKGAE